MNEVEVGDRTTEPTARGNEEVNEGMFGDDESFGDSDSDFCCRLLVAVSYGGPCSFMAGFGLAKCLHRLT